jgi:hypothetical protein
MAEATLAIGFHLPENASLLRELLVQGGALYKVGDTLSITRYALTLLYVVTVSIYA